MKAKRVKGLDPDAPFRENAQRMLDVRLRELRKLGRKGRDEREVEALHDTRIAAKRVRYLLEIAEPCFDDSARDGIRLMRRLQDLLGTIHDCDVMGERAREHALAVPIDDPRYVGFQALASYLDARRRVLHRHYVNTWPQVEEFQVR